MRNLMLSELNVVSGGDDDYKLMFKLNVPTSSTAALEALLVDLLSCQFSLNTLINALSSDPTDFNNMQFVSYSLQKY